MKKARQKNQNLITCKSCGRGTCCRDGVEVDLFEVASILKISLDIPKPWFEYVGRDKRFPSGFKFSTVLRNKRCVFQADKLNCSIYEHKPHLCTEFPMERGRVAPYYHELCHHAKSNRNKKSERR